MLCYLHKISLNVFFYIANKKQKLISFYYMAIIDKFYNVDKKAIKNTDLINFEYIYLTFT